ncbi:MAG: glycosyltransferase family 2 protein [Gaiellaceae bacterium]
MERLSESLCVVIPVWNEEGVIGDLLAEIDREVRDRFEQIEIVVVDDASTDATPAILAGLGDFGGRLHVLRSDRNRGHGPSVLLGLQRARGDWILQLDSDGQFVVAELWSLWERREDADLVLGVRLHRHDPAHRLVLSRIVSTVVSLLAGSRLRDPNVPFRLVRRSLWDDLSHLVPQDALAPSILVALGASVRGYRVVEAPVSHRPRTRGRSSLRSLRLVRFSLRGLVQLVVFRYSLHRAPGPR